MTANDTSVMPLVVWGASGHAAAVAEMIRGCDQLEIAGFIDDVDPARAGEVFCDSTILGGEGALHGLTGYGVRHVVLGFGIARAGWPLRREFALWV